MDADKLARRTTALPRLVQLCALALLIVVGHRPTFPPTPRPPASAADFSTDNALAHVRAIATEPHPAGSPANEHVRAYIVDQLEKLDLNPKVQSAAARDYYNNPVTIHNVLARLPAPLSTQNSALSTSILLVAHYDSVSRGPGAGDDTAAVAAILETMRALRAAAPPLKQDVRVLITDGEEMGLLGARAFVESASPAELASISLVLNFDARGTAGPSIMYEAAPGSLALIDHFAAADPYPVGNSLAYDVSQRLPNGSDFMVFRPAGLKGLNFALIGNYFYYHTRNDTPENLDPASVYHHGQHMLALARHFAGLSAAEVAAITADDQPGVVYFNLFTPSFLARYSAAWIWPLTALLFVVTIATLTLAFRRRYVTPLGLLGAFARLTVALLLAPAAVWGLMLLLPRPLSPSAFTLQLLAFVALAVIVTVAVALELRRRTTLADLAAAGVILFGLLAIPVNLYLPGGSFLFLWPPLFVTLGLFAAMLLPAERPWPRTLASVAAFTPTALLIVPLVVQLFTALTLTLAPACAIGVVLVTWLILGAFTPPASSTAPAARSAPTPADPAPRSEDPRPRS